MEGRIFYFGCSECVEYFDSPDQLRSHERTHVKNSPSPIHEDLLDTKCFDHNYDNLVENTNDEVLVESEAKLSNLIATHSELEIDSEFEDVEQDPLVNSTEDEDMDVKPALNGEKENALLPNDTKVDGKKVVVQKDGFYICQLCNFKFRKFVEFNYHYRKHAWKLKRKFVSTYCENDDGKLVRVEVKRPKIIHKPNTSGESFKCTQCPQSFPRLCSLERHVTVVHKVSTHCRRTQRDIRPIQIDDFGAEHQCSFCPASYTNKVDARFHEKTYHSGNTPFICEFCSCSFSLAKGLKCHLSKFHKEIAIEIRRMSLEKSEEKGNKHPLEVNSSHISDPPSPMNQMNTQSPNRKRSSEDSATKINTPIPNQKKTCEDSATDHLNISKHKVTPGGVVMIYADDMYCSYCPLSFTTKLGKKDHERIHTGETPYSCEYCPVTFRLRYTFLSHMKNSHPGKPYSTRYAYKCEICDATFNFKSMLENHQQNAHQKDDPEDMKVSSKDEISVSCHICGSSFKGERGLAIHSSMIHRSES